MKEVIENATTTKTVSKREALRGWVIFAVRMAVLLSAIYIVLGLLFCLGHVQGRSMEPTFHDGNILFGIRTRVFNVELERGDIVMAWDRNRDKPIVLVKRVIGLPGDTIEVDKAVHAVYLNGELLEEPYLTVETYPGDMTGPVTVEAGHVFVMGDNRINSNDSRYDSVGQIPFEEIVGKVLCRVI